VLLHNLMKKKNLKMLTNTNTTGNGNGNGKHIKYVKESELKN